MRKCILLALILPLFGSFGYTQTSSDKTIFKKVVGSGQTASIKFSVSNYSFNTVVQFKNELLTFQEKILTLVHDKAQQTILITYNEYMLKEDFIAVCEKYNIAYHKNNAVTANPNTQPQ